MLKGFSIMQPHASLVAIEAKRWETRDWNMRYRGELAIHASKGFPTYEKELCSEEPFVTALEAGGITTLRHMPLGAIVCLADVFDCKPTEGNEPDEPEYSFGNYGPNRFMIGLRNVRRLRVPVPCKGSLGLWMVPPDIERAVREQLQPARWRIGQEAADGPHGAD